MYSQNMHLNDSVWTILSGVLLLAAYSHAVALKLTNYSEDAHSHSRDIRQLEDIQCTLPPHPQHGRWSILEGQGNPGDKVPLSTVITYECASRYKLTDNMPLVCFGKWSAAFPECEELCPRLYSSNTYDLKCVDKIGVEVNCHEATHGTNLEYSCKKFYETPFGFKKTLFCEDGKWDYPKPVCQPVCGKKITNDTNELLYGAKASTMIEYPWVAAVYQKIGDSYEHICGGSILSQTVILTAAHCVTNNHGDAFPVENYMVGVGKLYRSYGAANDTRAQYSELFKIIVPKDYKADIRKYAADLALLVLKKELTLNETVQPVCFTNLKNIHLHAGNRGEIAGWGFAEGDEPSEILRSLVIPYKYETLCASELPAEWADKYNLGDKICAGFVNMSTSVCKGDSGGGLVFKYRDENRYYVHGVVSVAHKIQGMCNIQQNAIYTKVAAYYDFINRLLTRYAPLVKDCVLPPFPENGKWTTDAGGLKPGDAAPSSTVLKVECNRGYKISSTRSVECSTGHNMPTCDRSCSDLKFPKDTLYQCSDRQGRVIDCSDATDGTTISYSCPRGYRTSEGLRHDTGTCAEGAWESPKPECLQLLKNCGKNVPGSEAEYPWNVGVYKLSEKNEEKYKYVCGGSLLSEYVVVTDIRCVTDQLGNVLPKEDFLMAAGKLYGKYEDPRDANAQILNISYIIVHPEYNKTGRVHYSVAFLLASTSFKFNSFVQPVCLADETSWSPSSGLVIGWKFEEGVPPEKVQALEVERGRSDSCKFPPSFRAIPNLRKVCSGFKDVSACLLPEDAGKGLVVKHPEDGRYYLYGVVSFYDNKRCRRHFWSTDLFHYRAFAERVGYIFSS